MARRKILPGRQRIVTIDKNPMAWKLFRDGLVVINAGAAPRPARPASAFFQWPLWKQLVAAFLLGCVLLALKLLILG